MKDLDLRGNNLVTQANNLVAARYHITKNEQLIISAMISFIDPNDKDFLTYRTSITQFAELLRVDKKSCAREIDEVTSRLLGRVIRIETPTGWEKFQWVSYAKANFKEDALMLKFHDSLKPYLLELKQRFTSFKLSEIIELKSIYSIRIYQLLRDFKGQKRTEFTYSLKDFRKIVLGEEKKDLKKYPQFKFFRVYVLNTAKKELDEKAGLSFTFDTIRIGRSIGKIKFSIVEKKQTETEATPQVILDLEAFGVKRSSIRAFYNEHGEQALINTLTYFKNTLASGKAIKNQGAYLYKLLKNNAGEALEAEREEAEKKEKERQEALKIEHEERRVSAIEEIEKSFRNKACQLFLDKVSEEEKQDIVMEAKKAQPAIADMIREVDSPLCLSVLISKIKGYEEDKQIFVNEELKKQGFAERK